MFVKIRRKNKYAKCERYLMNRTNNLYFFKRINNVHIEKSYGY